MPKCHTWNTLWKHYNNIKTKFNLSYTDIYKQLNMYYLCDLIKYLSEYGLNNKPSNKPGTIGRYIRDILNLNYNKTYWTPSIVTYEDKLFEFDMITNKLYGINYNVIEYINNIPNINIILCLDECQPYTIQELKQILTINNITPKIININYRTCI